MLEIILNIIVAYNDLKYRKIHNITNLIIYSYGLILVVVMKDTILTHPRQVLEFVLVNCFVLTFYWKGQIGAGDVKCIFSYSMINATKGIDLVNWFLMINIVTILMFITFLYLNEKENRRGLPYGVSIALINLIFILEQ